MNMNKHENSIIMLGKLMTVTENNSTITVFNTVLWIIVDK